jgi:hypothetical protein
LAKRQLKQNLDGKAQLDRHVHQDVRLPILPASAASHRIGWVDQKQHQTTPLKRAVQFMGQFMAHWRRRCGSLTLPA